MKIAVVVAYFRSVALYFLMAKFYLRWLMGPYEVRNWSKLFGFSSCDCSFPLLMVLILKPEN